MWLSAARTALLAELLIYVSALGLAGLHRAIQERKFFILAGLPLAIAVMHLAWGAGFLWSMITAVFVMDKNG
ncbi:MAG: hypothetical protein A2Z03_07270 [Chloroflexi bacterium RBG_16_56_8]|nr:MAG: hypothetical protein A2Z03_07270 [Chloroflexi bacterium RBG_16_56_8]